MNKIYNIKYIDAFYSYDKKCPNTKTRVHEAFGYISKTKNDIIIKFIKENNTNNKNIIKGLVIPKQALLSNHNKKKDFNFSRGDRVSIKWKDIVYVANISRQKSSKMNTTGIIFKNNSNCVVLIDSKTYRTYPKPKILHPQKNQLFI